MIKHGSVASEKYKAYIKRRGKACQKVRKLLYVKGEGDTTLVSTVSPARTEMLICMMQFD